MSEWYADGTIDGRQWTLIRGSHVRTPDGDVPLPLSMVDGNKQPVPPPGIPQNLLYLRVSPDGSKFAGVGNLDDICWEREGGAWLDRGIAFGPQSVVYDLDNVRHVVPPPEAFGYRYVKPNNQLVTCTDSHFDQALKIWDYTKLGDVFIGQGGDGPHGEDPCIAIEADGSRRLISEGRCRFINAYREGDQFAIYCVREDTLEAKRFLLTRQQIAELPLIEADSTPVKPKPIPLDQVEPLVGKWLVSYYEQNGNVPDGKLPPGNAMVAVRNQNNDHGPQPRPMIITAETEGKVTGTIIAYRIGSEAQFVGEVVTIEVMEARARAVAAKGYRPWFYWDEPTTPRAPVLPTGSVVEVFGFCGRDESIADWEHDRRQRLHEAAAWPGNYLLAISAQTHDTNDSLKPEPSVMIPPMVRLCQWARAEFGDRFLGPDIFNNSGRDFPLGHPQFGRGGLTANPQLVPHWTKVFSGVTGLPTVLLPETPMYQRQSPDYTAHVVKVSQLFPAEWDRANKEKHGDRTDEFIKKLASYLHHTVDKKVGLNGKRGSDELSKDALAYKNDSAPGGAEVIDVIVGAGHKPTWADATIPPVPHPQSRPEVPEGVLGKFIQPGPWTDVIDPPTDTHRYRGGGNDTGICDVCQLPRGASVHAIPESKVRHAYDGGEHDTGQCDICGRGTSDPLHQQGPPIDPPDLAATVKALEARIKKLEARPFPTQIALKSAHGQYVVVELNGQVLANRERVGPWEILTVEPQ